MKEAGTKKQIDYTKMGPTLTIASSFILGIRTASWPATTRTTASEMDWEIEVEHAVRAAVKVMAYLTATRPSIFPSKDVPWFVPEEEDTPK